MPTSGTAAGLVIHTGTSTVGAVENVAPSVWYTRAHVCRTAAVAKDCGRSLLKNGTSGTLARVSGPVGLGAPSASWPFFNP